MVGESTQTGKTIAFVNTCSSWGGGEKWHFDTANYLHQLGYNVIFFARSGSEIAKRLEQAGIQTQALSISNLSFLNPFKLWRLAKQFSQLKIATLLLNTPADTKLAAPAAKLAGINNVIFRRGMPHRIKSNLLNRFLFDHCIDRVIANSHAVKDSLSVNSGGIVADTKIVVVENGIALTEPASEIVPLRAKSADEIVLSSAGRMVKQKNQHVLLAMASKLQERGLNFRLLIAGTGELEAELKAESERRQLQRQVIFTGFVKEMPGLFASTDIFVFPSLYEGSPNTLIEAAAAAMAIVAFDIPPHRELLPSPSMARLVPLNDIDGMTAAVMELAQSAELRQALGKAARKRIAEGYSLQQVREKLLRFI
jgi:glycosyltransferase involved in cell wall biosynthesis